METALDIKFHSRWWYRFWWRNTFFRTFNDGLNFPDTHPGNGCESLDTFKCKLLSSDLDNTFLGSVIKMSYFKTVIIFMVILMVMEFLFS